MWHPACSLEAHLCRIRHAHCITYVIGSDHYVAVNRCSVDLLEPFAAVVVTMMMMTAMIVMINKV